MRNLKRALSLALASVMLLGMMVVGTSAASYPDVDENDNVEAIEVLNAVQVMIGDRGNFRPDAAVNRHEMAVIMAKLYLGSEEADNYVGTHPFTDVFPWADKYVAACYENGLVSGTSATTFSGNQPLTAVQAALMILRALGYEDLTKGASDWRAPVIAAANRIRLFDSVASNPSQQLTRNQVAQLALNTLKSTMVDTTDNSLSISGGSGDNAFTITGGGGREYTVRASADARIATAISATEYQGTGSDGIRGWTLELGEHLYNGKLTNRNVTDEFGRPARAWGYNGKAIGTYIREELLRAEYTKSVTGRELYDLLGSAIINNYDFNIYMDGLDDTIYNSSALFTEGAINRNNNDTLAGTGKGVLTQVFVETNSSNIGGSVDADDFIRTLPDGAMTFPDATTADMSGIDGGWGTGLSPKDVLFIKYTRPANGDAPAAGLAVSATLTIKNSSGKTVYAEQKTGTIAAANAGSEGSGYFYVQVSTKNSTNTLSNAQAGFDLSNNPLPAGKYTWTISGQNITPINGEFTIQ